MKIKKLNFEYCECGCKCFTADKYSIYWDLGKKYFLWEGYRQNQQIFPSMKDAEAEAQKRFEAEAKERFLE